MAKKKTRNLNSEKPASARSKLRKELDKFATSLTPLDDSAPMIRADRGR